MNYYEILRVPSTATLIDIKNAYKKLVKKYHPDIYEGNKLFAEAKIKEINEAYEVLSEKQKKDIYDAELNYKKYEPSKSDFVKTYTKEDLNNYRKAYYNQFNKNVKKNTKVKRKKLIDLNAIGKKYFFKIDSYFEKEEKENFIILLLVFGIMFSCLSLSKYII